MLIHGRFCDILCHYLGEGRPRICSSVFYQAAAFRMWLNLPMCLPIGCWFQGCFTYILKFSYFLSYFDTIQYPFTYISCCSLCSALGYGLWRGGLEFMRLYPWNLRTPCDFASLIPFCKVRWKWIKKRLSAEYTSR